MCVCGVIAFPQSYYSAGIDVNDAASLKILRKKIRNILECQQQWECAMLALGVLIYMYLEMPIMTVWVWFGSLVWCCDSRRVRVDVVQCVVPWDQANSGLSWSLSTMRWPQGRTTKSKFRFRAHSASFFLFRFSRQEGRERQVNAVCWELR